MRTLITQPFLNGVFQPHIFYTLADDSTRERCFENGVKVIAVQFNHNPTLSSRCIILCISWNLRDQTKHRQYILTEESQFTLWREKWFFAHEVNISNALQPSLLYCPQPTSERFSWFPAYIDQNEERAWLGKLWKSKLFWFPVIIINNPC